MSQPTPYDRQANFTDHSAEFPSVPQPGASLDAEFNGIKETLDGTLDNLALIQADDGRLKAGAVHVDAMAPELRLAIADAVTEDAVSIAQNSANAAAASATAAGASSVAAASSAGTAAGHANAADDDRVAAQAAATAAGNSATAASNSATAADTAKTGAQTAKTNAETAAANAAADRAALLAAAGSGSVGFVQGGAGAVARTAQEKLRDTFNLFDYLPGANDAAKRAFVAAGNSVSTHLSAAMADAYARGGGNVHIPAIGVPYVIGAGVTVPEGVWVVGVGRTYHGPPYFGVNEWTDKGTWLQPTDTVNPAFTLGYGCGLRGLNFIYAQPAPVASVAYVPTVFPYTIRLTQSMAGLDDIWIIAATHGINVDYPSANGGGTFCWLNNIFLDTFNVGVRFKCVNDVVKITNFHQRPLWNWNSAEVQAYHNANTIGWDINYCDNLMADGVEFLHSALGIKLTDATTIFGPPIGNITQACGYLQLSNIQFNLCKQAIAVAAGTTKGQIMMQNVLAQSDITTGAAADWFFDFGSDNMEVMICNLWANFVGRGIAKIGNGTGGKLVIGGSFRGAYSGNGTTYNAISIGAGATCAVPAGIQEVFPLSGASVVFAGAGSPLAIKATDMFVGKGGIGDVGLHGGDGTRCGYIEFRQPGGTRQGYIGFSVNGVVDFIRDSTNVFRFNHAPFFQPGASVTPAANGDVTFQLTSNTQLTFKAKGSDGTVRSGNLTLA